MSLAVYSLKGAPSLIEHVFPVQRLSVEIKKEKSAGSGQSLTGLGSYWKGRKPLLLNKACLLGCLLPWSGDAARDLHLFELLMGMDEESLRKRLAAKLPKNRADEAVTLLENYKNGECTYENLIKKAKRPEELDDEELYSHIWTEVNAALGTEATSLPKLVQELGMARYGHTPKVADVFSGSGQIPFEAARLGCDVYASDLSPVACLLTWSDFQLVGGDLQDSKRVMQERVQLAATLQAEMDALGVETDGNGWRAKVYLYCLEVRCPQSGWMVPVLSTLIVSDGSCVVARLVPDPSRKRYDIAIEYVATKEAVQAAKAGTLVKGCLVHSPDGEHVYRTSWSEIRGDVKEQGENRNRLRLWENADIVPRPDDILQERLYCVQWVRNEKVKGLLDYEFRAVTEADLAREQKVTSYVQEHLAEWQDKGYMPNMRIERGYNTDQPIRERGWTYWHHLFNPRQLLQGAILRQHMTKEMAPFVMNAFNWNARLSMWNTKGGGGTCKGGCVQNVFYNQALNCLNNYGCRGSVYMQNLLAGRLSLFPLPKGGKVEVHNHPAAQVAGVHDLFITDPPYGDAVNYEEIYEFFIAWMRKNPPQPFDDWTWDSRRALAIKGTGQSFKSMMVEAYRATVQHMAEQGMQVLMFTHKSGAIWGDLAKIIWAAGLRVVSSWYVVTEMDSALRTGANVTGTVLLVLRKAGENMNIYSDDLAYELKDEIKAELDHLQGQNSTLGVGRSEGMYKPVDLQMAGYTAALRVLTKYSHIDGKDMRQEAMAEAHDGRADVVDSLIRMAQDDTEELLKPAGLPARLAAGWNEVTPTERFYLKMMSMESEGNLKLDSFTNMARALHVTQDAELMSDQSHANAARLKLSDEFGRTNLAVDDPWGGSALRAVLYAISQIRREVESAEVLRCLQENCHGRYASRFSLMVGMSLYIAQERDDLNDKEGYAPRKEASAARILAAMMEDQAV